MLFHMRLFQCGYRADEDGKLFLAVNEHISAGRVYFRRSWKALLITYIRTGAMRGFVSS